MATRIGNVWKVEAWKDGVWASGVWADQGQAPPPVVTGNAMVHPVTVTSAWVHATIVEPVRIG